MIDLRSTKLCRLDSTKDIPAFEKWLWEGKDARFALSFDTETAGLKGKALEWYLPGFKARLVQFGDCDKGFVLRADRFGSVIEEVFTEYDGDFVSHNGIGFDSHVLDVAGFSRPPMHRWHDTLMQSRVLDSRGSHKLKDLAAKKFGSAAAAGEKALNRAFELHGFAKNEKGRAFSEIPYGVAAYDCYSAIDVIIGARLDAEQRPLIYSQYAEAYERELASWWVTNEHETKGLPVDEEYGRELQSEYVGRLEIVRGQLQGLGIQNPNSKPQKLKVLLLEGFEAEDFTETGEPKLDKAVLEKIASPTALLLMEHSRIEGWLTKYINKVVNDNYEGRVYPSFNPFGAKTGRQAAYGPPVQQLPGRHEEAYKIRRLFCAEEDQDLWSIDYDGQENRLAAHFSGDEALTKLIMSGAKIHRYTAAKVYEKSEDEVTHDEYNTIKGFVYAEQYGAGIKKLMKMTGLAKDDVMRIKDGISEAYPQLAAWKRQVQDDAKYRWRTEGDAYAFTWGGRRVYADQYEDKEPAFYTLTNYVLQGSGADILKMALNRIAAAGLSEYIYLPVHDELLFSLPTGPEGEELAIELARLMAFPTEFSVPMTCSPEKLGKYWTPHA